MLRALVVVATLPFACAAGRDVRAPGAEERGSKRSNGTQPEPSALPTVSVSLSVTPNSVFENGGGANVHASISQAQDSTITVTVSTSSSHITQSGTTLTIPARATQSYGTVVLTAIDNELSDGDRQVAVDGSASGMANLVVASTSLEVVDDEGAARLEFRLSASSIYESVESLRGGVNKTSVSLESSQPAAADISVTVSVAPYSNNAKMSDFAVSGSVLTIPTGSTTSTGEVTITAVDNAVENAEKTISVSGTVDGTNSLDPPALHHVSILNDDPPALLRIRPHPEVISEDGGVTKVTMTADAPVLEDISVTLALQWGDSSLVRFGTNRILRIGEGKTTSTDTVTITAVDNNTAGYGKVLRFGRTPSRLWGSYVYANHISIYEDDRPAGWLLLSAERRALWENEGPTRIFATLSEAPTDTVKFEVGIGDHTTADPADYEFSTNRVLVIPPGATLSTGEVTLRPVDNDYYNPKHNPYVYLGATVTKGQDQVSEVQSVSNIVLRDDEPPPRVTLKLSSTQISENGGTANVTAELDTPLKGETTTVTVASDPVLPTTEAADFTQTGKTLTIAAGATTSTGSVTIAAIDNTVDEPNKTVAISGAVAVTSTNTSYYVGRIRLPTTRHLGIADDDRRRRRGDPTRPGAPVGLEAAAHMRHAIVLSWTPPSDNGGFEVSGYRIEVSADAGETWSNLVAINGDETEFTDAVAPGTTRHYRVRASNSLGESEPSNVATATTPKTMEPGAPLNLEALANGRRIIELSWSSPSDNGGVEISGYRIEISADAEATWSDLLTTTEGGTTTYRHWGVPSATTRHYRVYAVNAVGESEPSNVASATTAPDTPPGPPIRLEATAEGHDAIVLSWTRPLDGGGSPIDGYHIEVSTDAGATWRELVANTGSSTTHRDAGLAAGTTRHYRVSAINYLGRGEPSNVASATTEAAASPSAPQDLAAIAGTTEVSLEWRPPNRSGGAEIERYEYRLDGMGDWVSVGLATRVIVTGLEAGRAYLVEVRAVNAVGPGPPASISVTLNAHPVFARSSYLFELAENVDGSANPAIMGAVLAEDPDGDRVTYEMAAADTSLFRVQPADGGVAYVGPGEDYEAEPNRYDFAVRADDGRGGLDTAAVTVIITPVNEPPEASDDDAETDEDTPVRIHPLDNDVDPDGDTLRVESVSEAGHGTVEIVDGKIVVYRPHENWHGEDRFTYVASDGALTDEATVSVTVLPVNDAPATEGTIPDQMLEEGGDAVELDVADYFSDVDGDALALAASSADPAVAAVSVSGAILTLTPVARGATTIDVDATDPGGLSARQTFAVEVSDRMVKSVLTDVFAAMGRGYLASMRATLSRRDRAAPAAGESRLNLFGRTVSFGAGAGTGWTETADALTDWIGDACSGMPGGRDALGTSAGIFSGLASDGVEPGVVSGCSLEALGGSVGSGGSAGWGASDLQLVLAGGGPEQAGGGGTTWTLWTQGDIQNFSGSGTVAGGYDGDLRSAYVGVDVQGARLLAGLAYARSAGSADWDVGKAAGRVTTRLNTAHPYLRWSNGATSVWAMLGVGRGTADHARTHSATEETSDLALTAGVVEVRHDLRAGRAGPQVGLRGDAGWARLSTDGGSGTIDGLDAAVRQARLGMELGWEVGSATSGIEPFGQVHVRRDDGDGLDGRGVELLGGLRARLGPVEIDAQGRSLAVHSAAGYSESGASVALRVGGNPGQPGLSLHVAPRWGPPAGPMSVLWQDHLGAGAQGGFASTQGAARSEGGGAPSAHGGMDASVGYGVALGEERILTPFARFAGSEHGRRLQLGVRLGSVELVSDLTPSMPASQAHRLVLAGRLTFGAGPPPTTHPDNAR